MSPTHMFAWSRCNHVQNVSKTSGAQHVQHVEYHVVRRDSSAAQSDKAETVFTSSFLPFAELLTNVVGEETGVPRETSR